MSAGNFKDRLFVQLEPYTSFNQVGAGAGEASGHLRRGRVKFDGQEMRAKLMDLPTVVESHKTIDKKTFYKTAEISQLLICKDGLEESNDESASEEVKEFGISYKIMSSCYMTL